MHKRLVSRFVSLWKLESLWVISVVCATSLAYSNSLGNSFQYDDIHSILENEHIRTFDNVARFFVDPTLFSEDPRGAMYRPVVLISYLVNYRIGEYEVLGYRVLNLALHVLNSLLVASLVRMVSKSGVQGIVAAFYFGLLPVNGEVVNYISSRSESLCTMFFLIGVSSYIRMTRAETELNGWTLLSAVGFLGALLTKSVGLTYLGVLMWYEYCQSRFNFQNAAKIAYRRQKILWAIGALYLFGTNQLISAAVLEDPVRPVFSQVMTQMKALVYYTKLLMVPWGLNVEHQFFIAESLFEPEVILSVIFLGSIVAIAWIVRKKGLTALWVAWPVIVLSPTILVPLNVLVNEHRLYLASVAVAAIMGALTECVMRGKAVVIACVAISALVFAELSHARNEVWRNSESLWEDALSRAPLMPRPHIYRADRFKEAGEYVSALTEYETALEVNPEALSPVDRVVIHNNIAATYLTMGRFIEALTSYRRALAIDPEYEKSREALDGLLAVSAEDRDPRAVRAQKEGLRLLVAGKVAEAIRELEESIGIQVSPDAWLVLGMAYERASRWEAAAEAYEALKISAKGTRFAKTAETQLSQIRIRLNDAE